MFARAKTRNLRFCWEKKNEPPKPLLQPYFYSPEYVQPENELKAAKEYYQLIVKLPFAVPETTIHCPNKHWKVQQLELTFVDTQNRIGVAQAYIRMNAIQLYAFYRVEGEERYAVKLTDLSYPIVFTAHLPLL